MLKDLCKVRMLGMSAAAAVSITASVVLIYRLVTPQSVQMMRTAELVALVAMLLLPALALLTMRRAARERRSAAAPAPSPRTSTHAAEGESSDRSATRHRRRPQPATQSTQQL